MYTDAYAVLGLTDFHMRLSRWDPEDAKGKDKYVDNPEAWAFSEGVLGRRVGRDGHRLCRRYRRRPPSTARRSTSSAVTVTGREESISTVQLDFAQPDRLGLSYIGPDGEPHMPYCIHRAPLSTHERMVAFLIEHFGGAISHPGSRRCRYA